METTETIIRQEIYHRDYNLDKKDNLEGLPELKAVFAIFAIVDEKPVNCRYISETENLQKEIKNIFENPLSEAMKKFIQGPWIKMLQYEIINGSSIEERQKVVSEWTLEHEPKISEEGEYPGYYDA